MKSILTAPGVTLDRRPPYGRSSSSLVPALAAAFIVFGAAPASADAPAVLRHDASVSERNALIVEVRVALARAARVFVEYDNPQAGRYRTPLSEPGAAHVIPLVRLRPETTYDYTIFVVEGSAADGATPDGADVAAGTGGRFTTGSLPLPLAAHSVAGARQELAAAHPVRLPARVLRLLGRSGWNSLVP